MKVRVTLKHSFLAEQSCYLRHNLLIFWLIYLDHGQRHENVTCVAKVDVTVVGRVVEGLRTV